GDGCGRGIRPGEPEDLMARADEFGDDGRADPAGCAGDENPHENLLMSVAVISLACRCQSLSSRGRRATRPRYPRAGRERGRRDRGRRLQGRLRTLGQRAWSAGPPGHFPRTDGGTERRTHGPRPGVTAAWR